MLIQSVLGLINQEVILYRPNGREVEGEIMSIGHTS